MLKNRLLDFDFTDSVEPDWPLFSDLITQTERKLVQFLFFIAVFGHLECLENSNDSHRKQNDL